MSISDPKREYIFKTCIVGDGSVGKTSLILRYVDKKFNEQYIMTIGANFAIKLLNRDDLLIRLQLWDLAGQKHFQFVRPSFYRGAFALIYVFDITKRDSFENISSWVTEAKQYIPNIPYALVGNKIDLVDERVVSKKEGQALAEKIGALGYFETSAKTAANVDELFNLITDEIIKSNLKHK